LRIITFLNINQVGDVFAPLDPIDFGDLFKRREWVDTLRKMTGYACIMAWKHRLDMFDSAGEPLKFTKKGEEAKPITDVQRRFNFYSAIRNIPKEFARPSLLTIPITGQRNRNHGLKAVSDDDDDDLAQLLEEGVEELVEELVEDESREEEGA
jgi:hypothetical protein